jgi:probable HAF family extracellular repeat protein
MGVGIAIAAWAGIAGAQQVVPLPAIGGSESLAWGINEARQIVGESLLAGDTQAHATIWESESPRDLTSASGGGYSVAYAINNRGDAAGLTTLGSGLNTATLWGGGGAPTDLGALMGAVGDSLAWAINDQGVVAGQAQLGPGFSKGYVYDSAGGRVVNLSGYMGGANRGINNDGVVVGSSFFFGDPDDAHIGTPDGRGGYNVEQIGPQGFSFEIASDINNNGTIVGWTNNGSGPWQACVFTPGERDSFMTLGSLPDFETSEAYAINDLGDIVGSTLDDDFLLDSHAWVWHAGEMYDLNDFLRPGQTEWQVLLSATGINNRGDIVGYGVNADGFLQGFVIYGAVPAPGGLAAMAMGMVCVTRRRR